MLACCLEQSQLRRNDGRGKEMKDTRLLFWILGLMCGFSLAMFLQSWPGAKEVAAAKTFLKPLESVALELKPEGKLEVDLDNLFYSRWLGANPFRARW